MKRIVIEIDGNRHQLVQNQRNIDYCTKDKCSLFGFCQRAPVAPCNIAATTGYHFDALVSRVVIHERDS